MIFIPTLFKVFKISSEQLEKIPDYISSTEAYPISRWDSLPDYTFLGTNLILTNNCNLACVYCYANCGPKKGIVMKKEIAIAAIDYISECVQKTKHNLMYANMFGGEPTQAWDTMTTAIYHLREKAKEIGCRSRATITTNGCMETQQVKWLIENIDSINISFDGYKKIQDAHRSNSFDNVFKNAKEIYKNTPAKLKFRSTVSGFSVDHLPEIVKFFGENFPGCNQMYEPSFSIGRGKDSKYGMPSSKRFFDKFLESLPIAEKFNCKLKTSILNLGNKSSEFCGVAAHNFMVTADGRCTTCNRMAEDEKELSKSFSYGHYNEENKTWEFNDETYQKLKNFSGKHLPECQNCFAFSSCRGDCTANKATLNPKDFWKEKSYRCKEIKEFVKSALLYILEKKSSMA